MYSIYKNVHNQIYFLSVNKLWEALLKIFLASLAETNLRMSLIPDSFLTNTNPFRYLARGISPGSYWKSEWYGEYSGTFKSFLACCSIRLSYDVTTIVLPQLQEGNLLQMLVRSFLIFIGVCYGWSPQSPRLVARMNKRSRQYLVKYLWQRSLVNQLLRVDHTATSTSFLRMINKWFKSYPLPFLLLTYRCLQESLYVMGTCCNAWSTTLVLGLFRQKKMLLIYIMTRNFFPNALINIYIMLINKYNKQLKQYQIQCPACISQNRALLTFLLVIILLDIIANDCSP